MFKKAVFITVLLAALSFGTAFAIQIDGMVSLNGPTSTSGTFIPVSNFVNPGGLADALIYGYYNVRDNFATFFTVTNTATYGVRARIRFREAATQTATSAGDPMVSAGCDNGSQEVLDFDICLTPGDMWSGVIQTGSNGAGLLTSPDTDTYVQTQIASTGTPNPAVIFPTAYPAGVSFKFGTNNVVTSITADQTREGYFEVIGERLLNTNCGGSSSNKCTCGDLLDVKEDGVTPIPTADLSEPFQGLPVGNVLMGHTYIVNLSEATTFAYAATALADFNTVDDITNPLTTNEPNLRDNNFDTSAIGSVNYALTKSNLLTVYDVESSVEGNTEVIITFPTKWATHTDYFDTDENACDPNGNLGSSGGEVANDEFHNDIFDDTNVKITVWDDKEQSPTSSCSFSPCPAGAGVTLPSEVNVVSINGSTIFTTDGLVALASPFEFGWLNIDLTTGTNGATNPPHRTACDTSENFECNTNGSICGNSLFCSVGDSAVTYGLPVIGYNVMKFGAGDIPGLIPLQYETIITPETD